MFVSVFGLLVVLHFTGEVPNIVHPAGEWSAACTSLGPGSQAVSSAE